MKNKHFAFIILGMVILASVLTSLWAQKTCSYCFQSYFIQGYAFQGAAPNIDSPYIQNIVNEMHHSTYNLLGSFINALVPSKWMNFFFWTIVSLAATLFLYRWFFGVSLALFAGLVYLTNPTLNVVVHTFAYYALLLFLSFQFLKTRKWIYLVFWMIIIFILFDSDLSPAFVGLFTSFFLLIFYAYLYRKEDGARDKFLIFIAIGSLLAVVSFGLIYELPFFSDFLHRVPLLLQKFVFYILSYPGGAYFYLIISARLLLVSFLPVYLYRIITNKRKLEKKELFIFSYFLTAFPLFILFTAFDVSARIFDYYGSLFAVISLREFLPLLKKNVWKIALFVILAFLIFFSIFLHTLPPRSLEAYSPEFIFGLQMIPQNATVYSDVFVANTLITQLDHVAVVGPDFNSNDDYQKIYYQKDREAIRAIFSRDHVNYFVISRHSFIRGLDVLNAPHVFKQINFDGYKTMDFLIPFYSNSEVFIWRFNESSNIS
ncbi:MAG TPA: hypothetical protein VJJ21_00040 [Candidatus Nanoarchaeia archaeon]|nr:hypothetical protein [Candidatus Nanoarchaeia archaeon]